MFSADNKFQNVGQSAPILRFWLSNLWPFLAKLHSHELYLSLTICGLNAPIKFKSSKCMCSFVHPILALCLMLCATCQLTCSINCWHAETVIDCAKNSFVWSQVTTPLLAYLYHLTMKRYSWEKKITFNRLRNIVPAWNCLEYKTHTAHFEYGWCQRSLQGAQCAFCLSFMTCFSMFFSAVSPIPSKR